MLLAIETSCDETAVAIFDRERYLAGKCTLRESLLQEKISSQTKLHVLYGGVVPELAAREHLTNLPLLVKEALQGANVSMQDVSSVAVTCGPGLKGCLLVGIGYATSLAVARNVRFYGINHLEGHICSVFLNEGGEDVRYPFIALLVSGGHTELVLVRGLRDYKYLARTRDDAAGEAFDKIATLLDLPYPGGPSLSALARSGNRDRFKFPVGAPQDTESFSFSGMKTAVLREVNLLKKSGEYEAAKADIAASAEWTIVRALVQKTVGVCQSIRPGRVLLTGGVAANDVLRTEMASALERVKVQAVISERRFCTDNAAMIGAVAMLAQKKWPDAVRPVLTYSGVASPLDVVARSRWPLEELQ